jgi:hypothetical protein
VAKRTHLRKKDNTWHVVVEIPRDLRKRAGRSRFKKSLGTDSLEEANRLKLPYLAEYWRQLSEIRRGVSDPRAAIVADALQWYTAYSLSSPYDQEEGHHTFNERSEMLSNIQERAKEISEKYGDEDARRFFGIATGTTTPLKAHYETFLSEFEGAEQTRSQHRAAIVAYIAWAGGDPSIEETDRRKAGEYLSHLIKADKLSRRTIERHKSSLSSLWRWLVSRGHAASNPWIGQAGAKKTKGRLRSALSEEALVKLLSAPIDSTQYSEAIHDLLRLALLPAHRI